MLAQQNLYPFLRGRRRASAETLRIRAEQLDGYSPNVTRRVQDTLNKEFIVGFEDGSYLEWRPEVGTWVAFHERWERKGNGND